MNPTGKTTAKWAALVFAVALAARLSALAVVWPKLNPDAEIDCYRSIARHLLAGEGFGCSEGRGFAPNIARTPVYPLLLAGLIHVFGDRLAPFLVASCIFGAFAAGLTVCLAARWLSPRGARVAGVLVALDPNSVLRCLMLLTEPLFTVLLVAGACLLAWQTDRRWAWAVAGLLWSVAALTRPIAAGLLGVAAVVAWASTAPEARERFVRFVLFALAFAPLLLAWCERNRAITGQRFVSTIVTKNLLLYRAAGIEAEQTGRPFAEVSAELAARYGDAEFFEGKEKFEQTLRDSRRVAAEMIRSAPMLFAKQTVRGWAMVLVSPGKQALQAMLRERAPPSRVWPWFYLAAMSVWVAAAAWSAWRQGRRGALLSALVAYFVLAAGGYEANSRFRVPITPMLAILAVAGAAELAGLRNFFRGEESKKDRL